MRPDPSAAKSYNPIFGKGFSQESYYQQLMEKTESPKDEALKNDESTLDNSKKIPPEKEKYLPYYSPYPILL